VVQSKWKRKLNCYEIQDTHTEPLKGVLKYLKGRYILLVGLFVDWNIFQSFPSRTVYVFKRYWPLGNINAQTSLSWRCVNAT
jgi:hypothetical protein